MAGITAFESIGFSATNTDEFSLPPVALLVDNVEAVLPERWRIQGIETNRVPPGWHSEREDSTVLTLTDGKEAWTLSFVPLDWVGIQIESDSSDVLFREADWAMQADGYKLLVAGSRSTAWNWLRRLAPQWVSLVNGGTGWQRHYGDRISEVEKEASRLMTEFCHSPTQRSEAADSLVRLGIPAARIYFDVALHGASNARQSVISALGELGTPGTVEVLRAVMRDPDRDTETDLARQYAVYACRQLRMNDHGPDLHVALQLVRNEEAAAAIAMAINEVRYAPAIPELRLWLRQCENTYFLANFARPLATLRANEAVNEIRNALLRASGLLKLSANYRIDPNSRENVARELHRLTGTWGETRNGVRVSVVDRSADTIAVHVENMSEEPISYLSFDYGTDGIWPMNLQLWVDGLLVSPPPPTNFLVGGHVPTIEPGTAVSFIFDIHRHLSPEGTHTISGSWSDVPANVVVVDSLTETSEQPLEAPVP